MKTEQILLDRAFGRLHAEDYVAWAVARLVAGDDTPDLRVLAGLNPRFDREEVERHFLRACEQLSIDVPDLSENHASGAVPLIRRLFESGELSARQVVDRIAQLHVDSDYSDPLLGVWYSIAEELALQEQDKYGWGLFYPYPLRDLDTVVRHEWTLFEWGLVGSELPAAFASFIRCEDCRYIGSPVWKRKTLFDAIKARLPWVRPKPPIYPACRRCGSFDYRSISDPEVRGDYFARAEKQSMTSDTRQANAG